MSHDDRGEFRFWRSVAVRLVAIALVGWASIVWFQGCLVPLIKNEVRTDQQKATGPFDAGR